MHEEATASETDRVIHRNQVTIGSVDANADAPRIHDHRAFLGQNGVSADRRRILWATHRRREHPRRSPVRSVVRRRAGSPGLTTEDIDAPDEPTKATGLWSRLNWHVSGRRSGYQFFAGRFFPVGLPEKFVFNGHRRASRGHLADRSRSSASDSSTPAGRMMIGVLGSLAEYERELTNERTALKRAASRANGTKFGRPRKVDDADAAKARQLREKGIAATDIAKMLGVSRATVYRYLAEDGAA